MITRRALLLVTAAVQAFAAMPRAAAGEAPSKLSFGPPEGFDFDRLKAMVAGLAGRPYVPPPAPDPAIVDTMTFDVVGRIVPDPDHALFDDGRGPYPVSLLSVGRLFPKTVRVFKLDGDVAREVLYRPDYFKSPPGGPLSRLPASPAPVAGIEFRRVYGGSDLRGHEVWTRFLGASYFRGVGESGQLGLSARGIALNSGVASPEEFPDFTHFWIAEGKTDDDPVVLYAVLDGPSVVGAYRILLHHRRATSMDITLKLHLRKPVDGLGLAPLTSMYWFSETMKRTASDWRPEVHDSDGLAVWTGTGEHLWRPLNDPETVTISDFPDDNPRGFGLLQRDRLYDHYLDAQSYEKRPSGWVQPIGEWGRGAVRLVEIPTDNEIYDNIVLAWVPAAPSKAGDVLDYRYELLWRDGDPCPGELALCVATRLGAGGRTGAPRSKVLRKFVLTFKGRFAAVAAADATPEAVLSTSRGTFSNVVVEPSPDGDLGLWRVRFDLDAAGGEPVELRCHLAFRGEPLTETWVYRYVPFASP